MTNNSPTFLTPQSHPSPWRRVFIIIVTIIILITLVSINEIYLPHPQLSGTRTIEIPSGFGSRMIGEKLKKEGFIRSKWMFVTYVSLRGQASSLKPGTYDFENASIPRIAKVLVKGIIREKIITLPEGGTLSDLAQILQDQNMSSGTVFAQLANNLHGSRLKTKYPFLNDISIVSGLEGYLFPDTYYMFKDTSATNVADIFLQNFDKKVTPEIRADITNSNKTLHEIVIMASLIEKEVISDQDRKMISGILWNRLRLNIPLQVDATINYIKKQQNLVTSTSGRVSRADLLLKSPYNTYLHRGLPIGPIGNPGMSAILSAIHPTPSTYLYYLSTPSGRTIFSKTLDEHIVAKRKYLTN